MSKSITRLSISILLAFMILLTSCSTVAPTTSGTASFRGQAERAANCNYGGEIRAVEAVDEYTVRFKLCYPDSTFPAKMASPIFAIQDSDYLTRMGGDSMKISQAPNGTGPYVLKEWLPETDAVLIPSANYWGMPPASPKVEFRWQPDQSRRFSDYDFTAIEGMDFPSIVMTKPFTYLEYTYANKDLKVVGHDPLNLYYIGFNNSIYPFDNPKVREAFALALNREKLLDLSFPGGTELAQQIIPTSVQPGRSRELRWYTSDPDKAVSLLIEAGFKFEQPITIAFPNSPMQSLYSPAALAAEIRTQMADIGVEVTMKGLDAAEFEQSISEGKEMFFINWFMVDYLDGSAFFEKPFVSQAAYFGAPYTDIQQMVKDVRGTRDQNAKQAIFDRLNKTILDQVPLIPLGHSPNLTVFRSTLQNISSNAFYENLEDIVSDKNIIRFVGATVPLSLWPSDEDDFVTFRITRLMYDTLLAPGFGGQDFEPLLAERWSANDDLTEWTFELRYNVKFADGSQFDANDVVASFAAIWDASNPNHKGRTGDFAYFRRLFGNLVNSE